MTEFFVQGIPGPQGSKKAVGRRRNGSTILIESSAKVKPWRQAVATVARKHCAKQLVGAVAVTITFYMPVPARMPKDRVHPSVVPDADKILRSTLDALSGIAHHDDGQVTHIETFKRYHPDGWTGAHIQITTDP